MQVSLKMEHVKVTSSNHLLNGLISSQDKVESFARNLASVQEWVDTPWILLRFVANLSSNLMEPVKSTSSYYILNGKQITTLRSLQANRSYAGYDPAKSSSKPVVCRLRPCEVFKQTGRMQVPLKTEPAKTTSSNHIRNWSIDVLWTLRSLQANRSHAGYDPAKPSSKPVVCRLRPCEAFKQTGRMQVTTLRSLQANRSYAGSIEDGTCENYFQQPYTQLHAGYDPAKPSSKPVVCRLRPCEAFKQTGRMQVTTLRSLEANRSYAGSIEDGTCENYFQQPFTQLYAGYDPAKPSSKPVVCRLRPCEAFKQTGRMQVPLKMEPAKTTSSNHIRNCMQVTTLRSLQANRSYAGYDPAKPSSKPVVCRLRPCEAFKQTGRMQVTTLRSLQANRSYAGSIEDGTCENYFQQPFTQLYAGYDPAKPSSKQVVCRLRPCEAFKQTGRMQFPLKMEPVKTTSRNHIRNCMQVTTLRSLEANRSYAGSIEDGTCENYFQQPYTQLHAGYDPAKPSSKPVVCRLRPCEAFKQTGRMQVTTLRSLQANRSYAGSIEDGTCENYFQQPYTQLCNLGDLMNGEDELY
eukprot:Em0004g1569a